MDNTKLQEILNLSKDEKLELVQTLWDNIAEEQYKSDVSKEHIIELEKRMKKFDDNTAKFISREEVQIKFESKRNMIQSFLEEAFEYLMNLLYGMNQRKLVQEWSFIIVSRKE